MSATGLVPALIVDRSAPFAAGALSRNVNDLAAWDSALISGKVVSPASFKEMTTPIPLTIGDGSGSYGFGLELGRVQRQATIWHDGGDQWFNADTEMFLDSGLRSGSARK